MQTNANHADVNDVLLPYSVLYLIEKTPTAEHLWNGTYDCGNTGHAEEQKCRNVISPQDSRLGAVL